MTFTYIVLRIVRVSGRVLVPESYSFLPTTLAWTQGAVPEETKKPHKKENHLIYNWASLQACPEKGWPQRS